MLKKYFKYLFAVSYVSFLVSQLWFASIYIHGYPLRAYCIALAFVLYAFMSVFFKEGFLFPFERRLCRVFGGFTLCAVVAFITSKIWYNEALSISYFTSLLFKFLLQGLMVFLITGFFIKQYSFKYLGRMLVAFGAISGFVAIMQFAGIESFWRLKYLVTTDLKQYMDEFILSHDDRHRAAGLSLYFISLSYEMLLLLPVALWVFLTSKKTERALFGISAFLILGGIIASKTISAYLGMALFILWILWEKRYYKLLGLLIITIVSLANLLPYYSGSILNTLLTRRGFWTVAILTIAKFPLGIPFLRSYVSHAEQFYPLVQGYCADVIGSSPHNQFLNTFLSYGSLSIIPYALFVWLMFTRRNDSNDRGALFVRAAMVAYGAHSVFHNLGPFYNDVFFWVLMAFYCMGADCNKECSETR